MGCRTQSLQEDYSVFKAEGWKYKQNKTENVKMQRTVMNKKRKCGHTLSTPFTWWVSDTPETQRHRAESVHAAGTETFSRTLTSI